MKKQKISITLAALMVMLVIGFFSFGTAKLNFGPTQGSQSYVLNNNPANISIRVFVSIAGISLLWYAIKLLSGSSKTATLLTIVLIPVSVIAFAILSFAIYGLG